MAKSETQTTEDTLKEDIESWMKNLLSEYCLNTCITNCCDYDSFISTQEAPFMEKGGVELEPLLGKIYNTLFGYRKPEGPCPYYDRETRKCLEHENPLRPEVCKVFPRNLDKEKKIVTIHDACELAQISQEELFESPLAGLMEICKKHNYQFVHKNRNIINSDGQIYLIEK